MYIYGMSLENTQLCQTIIAQMLANIHTIVVDVSELMYRGDVMGTPRSDDKSSIAVDWDGESLDLWKEMPGSPRIAKSNLYKKFIQQFPPIIQKHGYKIVYASDTTIVLQQE